MSARITDSAGRPRPSLPTCDEAGKPLSSSLDADVNAGHRFTGQLWERLAEIGESGVVNLPLYTSRIADAYRRAGTDRQAPMVEEFTPTTMMQRRMADGHYLRTGHKLTGVYVQRRTDLGLVVFKLIRTCGCDHN